MKQSKQFSIMAKNTGDAKTSEGIDVSEIVLGTLNGDGSFTSGNSSFFRRYHENGQPIILASPGTNANALNL